MKQTQDEKKPEECITITVIYPPLTQKERWEEWAKKNKEHRKLYLEETRKTEKFSKYNREYQRKYREKMTQEQKDRQKQKMNEWHEKNKEYTRDKARRYQRKKTIERANQRWIES